VHVTQEQQMDFIAKNFIYRTLPLGEAVKRCASARHDDFFVSAVEMSVPVVLRCVPLHT
jgi:tRNA wybutosine-synthesizing protein 5